MPRRILSLSKVTNLTNILWWHYDLLPYHIKATVFSTITHYPKHTLNSIIT